MHQWIFSNSTQKLGRLVVQKSEIFLKGFEFDKIVGITKDSWKSNKVLKTHFEHLDLTAYTVNGKSISQ